MNSEWYQKVSSYISRRFNVEKYGSFAFIGIFLTLYGAVFIQVCVWLHIDANLANLAQALISVVSNFQMNRRTTWKNRRDLHPFVQGCLFAVGKLISIPLNAAIFAWVLSWSTPLIAYGISTIVITFYNLVLGEKIVFGTWYPPLRSYIIKQYKKVRK